MAKEPKESSERPSFEISHFIHILNSVFETAKFNITIIELAFFKEQVVIGFPQAESLENELKSVETAEGFELGARYIVLAEIASNGRRIPIYVRFYLTSDGKLKTEDSSDNGTTLTEAEEAKKPEAWKKVIDYVVPWGPIIIRLILSYFRIIAGDQE